MNFRHMEIFHAVYQNGSVIGAAQILHISQPSVSRMLAHTESKLGFALFRRIRGRLVPTDEAHIIFREIGDLHAKMQIIQKTAKNLKSGSANYLRLIVLPALGHSAAPEALAKIYKMHPTASFDVHSLHHDDILRSLIERDGELAVGYEAPNHPRMQSLPVGKGELVVLFRKKAIPNPPARIKLSSLKDLDFITVANSGPLGTLYSGETMGLNLELKERISVRTFFVAAGLVKFGVGITVLDEFTARASLTKELDFRPLDPPISFGVHAIHLADRPPSRLARDFLSVLSEILNRPRSADR